MGPLNDVNKLQLREVNKRTTKAEKIEKSSKMYYFINFKTIKYKLSASGNIIWSITNYKHLRPVSILRLPKE